ncbi:hypothetical protein AMECASPLE_033247 [Ameca splendens]|uniref:Uncharacterized protein n=1 Tax=Ameca splendens TaxID=208324 RepID=A0ABV0ZFL0_9TELE
MDIIRNLLHHTWPHKCGGRHHHRRGKRGGHNVKLLANIDLLSQQSSYKIPREYSDFIVHHPMEYCYRWLRSTDAGTGCTPPDRSHSRIRGRGRMENLHSLGRVLRLASQGSICMALFNTRSLTNKTFILKDYFCSHSLDFLLLTET